MGEFSFKVPEALRGDTSPRSNKNPAPEDFEFSKAGQADVKQTLKRISETPDGRELIKDAFRDAGADRIHILDGSKHDIPSSVIRPANSDPGIILN